ncbi:hypothetical protein ABHA52_10605 [Enterococcus faecium]|uniref:hypothetical protein n=1 Tax=Enterococcus faecium TaxID=1352 RepID=UPI001106CBE3|nr:hypothetical protein [Enterococcus faecium]MDB7484787.1 hypothetical protein [Enterococcus faecium]MDB7489819.1 hypothetical protein [Enterococcus faecium]MDB7492403.1 hypothetical protein [Enterococcus faecium]MDB7495025.1 hypothetical protein [Enterococcus faecium]MDB7497485.1 hypothetical protein [Enterococcus faecium]
MSNDFRDLKSNTENQNKENQNKKDKSLDILKDKLKNTDYKQKINDLGIESKAKFALNKTKEGLTKTKEVYQAEETQIILKKIMNILYKLFRYYPLFLFKYKLRLKYVMSGNADFMLGMSKKEKEEIIKEYNKKNLLDTLYLYSPFFIILLSIFFAYCLQNIGYGLKPLIFLNLTLLIFPIFQHFRISTGRADVDTIIDYYLELGVGISDLREIVEKYEEIRKGFRDIYLTSKSRITDMTLDFDDKLGVVLQLDLENASDKTINTLANIDYLKPFENFGEFYVVANNKAYMMFDIYLSKTIYNKDFDFVELFKDNASYFNYFKDFEALRKKNRINDLQEKMENQGLDINANKLMNILDKIEDNKEELGFNAWDSFGKTIEGNKNYIRLNCKFLKGINISNLKKDIIESIINEDIEITASINSKQTFTLTIIFKKFIDDFELKYDKLVSYAREKNQILLGKTITGEFVADMTSNAFFPFISGESGSGKSVTTMGEMVQILEMRDFNFEDLFVISGGKTGDYYEAEFDKRGALILDVLEESTRNGVISEEDKVIQITRAFELAVKKMLQREALFKEYKVRNIYKYNEAVDKNKISGEKLGEVLLVIDEAQSLLNIADSYKIDKVSCKDKILSQIRKILSLGRASGFKLLYVTQSAKVSDLGDGIKDGLTLEILGRNKSNVLMGVDKSGALSKYFAQLSASGRRTEGVVFVRSSVIQPTTEQLNFKDGFVLCKTPFVDNQTIAKGFKQSFETYNKYNGLIKNFEIDISDFLNGSITSDTEILEGDFEVVLNDSEDNESVNQESIELNIEESENTTNIESVENILDTIDLDL